MSHHKNQLSTTQGMVLGFGTRVPSWHQNISHNHQHWMYAYFDYHLLYILKLSQIPLCAEFAQEEVLQMLMTVLPEETALVCTWTHLS